VDLPCFAQHALHYIRHFQAADWQMCHSGVTSISVTFLHQNFQAGAIAGLLLIVFWTVISAPRTA
jgi:hypothetical protein